MTNLADEMFELSLAGYGTKQLAKLAKVSIGYAILLQSDIPNVSKKSFIIMRTPFSVLLYKLQKKDASQ